MVAYGADILSNLYIYDYDAFRKQIDECDFNVETANALTECALIMINVYDINRDCNFLDLAEYLLDKIKVFLPEEIYMLNVLQIKKRQFVLNEDDKKMLEKIGDDNPEITFGKYVLLDNKEKAKAFLDLFSEENKRRYEEFPIYRLYKQL